MANLLYRVTTTPPTPTSTAVNNGALTSTQIDGNFKSLNDELITKAPLTGEGVSGTWSISISGNAGTVTNGVVTTGSYSNPAWITSLSETKVLPAQTNNSGKFLTTNGTSSSWVTIDAFPSQTGNAGKFLTTNGTAVSWATVDAFPSQTGNAGKFLTTNGTAASWSTIDKTSLGLGNVENTALSTWSGSTNITTIGAATATSLTVNGNLTVNGTTTTINSNTISVDDKNIEIGAVVALSNISGTISSTATTTTITGISSTVGMIPGQTLTRVSGTGNFGGTTTITSVDSATQITITSATANTIGTIVFNVSGATDGTATGGGITLKGATDKSITWSSTGWTSSEDFNLISDKSYKINGTVVLSSTTLGSGVISSSLTGVGTLTNGTWNASVINSTYGGTGVNNGGRTITVNTGNLTLTAQSGGSSVAVPSSGTLATLAGSETLTNKSLSDNTTFFIDETDATKKMQFQLSGITTSTTRTLTIPNVNGTIITTGDTGTVTNAMLAGSISTSKISGLATSATTDTTNAGNITSGTLSSSRLPSIYIGTTAAQFASANQALIGISSVTLPGSTSGAVQIIAAATAGTGTVITLPATTGTVVTTGDTGTVTNAMLAGSISTSKISGLATSATTDTTNAGNITSGTLPNARLSAIPNSSLANSTISGISLGSNLNSLTLAVSGTGLSGSASYNGSTATTFTVTSNATNTNTASTIVARDASGNFSAGTITATLSGNASTVTNGVYTNETYADPSWITSLSKSKVGLGNVENTALSTWSGSSNITTIGDATASSLIVTGNLTVNGTTTTINSTTVSVDDKNIELGAVVAISSVSGNITSTATTTTITGITSTSGMIPGQTLTRVSGTGAFGGTSTITSVDSATQITITSATANTAGSIVFNVSGATDVTASGGGITLKGTTDKTIMWSSNSWTSSENINIDSGKTYKINGVDVVSSSALGSGITSSSLTSVGTISSGTWQGTDVGLAYGGTNASLTAVNGGIIYSTASAMAITAAGTAGQILKSNGTSAPSWIDQGFTIVDDTSTNTSYYLALQSTSSGNSNSINVSSTQLYFNPSTGILNSYVFNSLSDENKKTNIKVIPDALNIVENVRGVTFNWKENNIPSAGLIAQDVEKYLPQLINTNEDIKSLNYNGIIGVLVEAIKELSNRVKKLESNI